MYIICFFPTATTTWLVGRLNIVVTEAKENYKLQLQ